MSVQPDRIKALISKIDEALSFSNPRPPLVVMGDSIIQSRQVLEQVRSYLLSLEPSHDQDDPDIIPRFSDRELLSLEESLRLLIREELQAWQTEFTQTMQAEIQAMRQERRVVIRELRLLRKQRQEAETASGSTVETQSPPSSSSRVSTVFIPPRETYIYPSQQERVPELFPYAGVELPPSMGLDSPQASPAVSSPPSKTVPQNHEPFAIASVNSDQKDEISLQALTSPVELESVAPELEISGTSQALEPVSTSSIEETIQNDESDPQLQISAASESQESLPSTQQQPQTPPLESVAPELQISGSSQALEPVSTSSIEETIENDESDPQLQISAASESQEPTPTESQKSPTVVSLDQDPARAENHQETISDRRQEVNDIFGSFDFSESVLETEALPSSSVTPTHPRTPPDRIKHLLDPEDYIHASPHENLLPHYVEEDDDEQVDSHLMVGKSIRQQLEEDLLNLEQQSFIGEEDSTPDFSNVNLTPEPTASHSFEKAKKIESFEQLWSETSPVEVNPFAEASASEMTLDELLTTLDRDEVKTINSEDESDDSDDLNFEALNRKLQ
ncbi:MAG: hypothetical protein VKK42_09575 [Lyngbya sp.]|nr:hypothetical protein [Lyngbya sp.]